MAAQRPPDSLRLTLEDHGDWTVVHPAGEIDFRTAGRLDACVRQLLTRGHVRIAIDLSAVEFCDSMGIRCFIDGWKRARRVDGDLVLLRPHEHVRAMLTVMGLDRFLIRVDELRPTETANDGDADLTAV